MASDPYLRDIERAIERMTTTLDRRLKKIEQIAELRRFDDIEPPPQGVVVQNMRGCVCINLKDYQKMKEKVDEVESGI